MKTNELIAVVYMNLGPYHLARMQALARVYPNLLVIEIAAKQGLYPWRPAKENLPYHLETLFNQEVEAVSASDQISAVKTCLNKYHPEVVVVSGYRHPVMRAAADWAKKRRKRNVLLFVSTALDHRRIWWREWAKRIYLRGRFSWFAVAGERSAQYARDLGIREEMTSLIGNVVDNNKITELAQTYKADTSKLRQQPNLPEDFFLYVGRLSPEKNLVTLVNAFSQYRKAKGKWRLVFVGNGPQEPTLKSLASSNDDGSLRFVQWKQLDELIAHYSAANALILPSLSEPWGLVVNEAMCCGLPLLVSRNCGCVPELCHEGENAIVFDPRDPVALTQAMLTMSQGDLDLNMMGKMSTEIIRRYTPGSWAKGLIRACGLSASD